MLIYLKYKTIYYTAIQDCDIHCKINTVQINYGILWPCNPWCNKISLPYTETGDCYEAIISIVRQTLMIWTNSLFRLISSFYFKCQLYCSLHFCQFHSCFSSWTNHIDRIYANYCRKEANADLPPIDEDGWVKLSHSSRLAVDNMSELATLSLLKIQTII